MVRGATEVCLQGGIHPDYTARPISRSARGEDAAPGIHVHAVLPAGSVQGARTLGIGLADYIERLRTAGLGSLPGTAAEILDDEVRAVICPDKNHHRRMARGDGVGAHRRTRFDRDHHVRPLDGYRHWARHLLRGARARGAHRRITEFVPLAFVHMESPMYLRGRARRGTDAPRSGPDARGRPSRPRPPGREHPGFVGEDGAGRGAPRARGGRERRRRDAHERVDSPARRVQGSGRRCRPSGSNPSSGRPVGRPGSARHAIATRLRSASMPRSALALCRSRSTAARGGSSATRPYRWCDPGPADSSRQPVVSSTLPRTVEHPRAPEIFTIEPDLQSGQNGSMNEGYEAATGTARRWFTRRVLASNKSRRSEAQPR